MALEGLLTLFVCFEMRHWCYLKTYHQNLEWYETKSTGSEREIKTTNKKHHEMWIPEPSPLTMVGVKDDHLFVDVVQSAL